ncbi:MAG: glycoside hydrolase family protein [Rikenellaceae bacterium]
MKRLILTLLPLLCAGVLLAQDVERERPAEWEGLVEGGRFMDRFMPMKGSVLSSDVWGAECVKPRFVDNGIENDIFSYWGGNITYADGRYNLVLCGWLENSPKGHMNWPNSIIMHTVSDKLEGPYEMSDIIGAGHNPELYELKDGGYGLVTIIKWKPYLYKSKSISGAWSLIPLPFDNRDREVIEGMSNLSLAKRPDGSQLMVCRGGGIWVSKTGLSDFCQITNGSVYPEREGRFEDPVIWRDNIQYHLIVNDWLGRIAYYLRSKDGVNWVEDSGEAYTPGVAVHRDGTVEDWYKFERIKIFQDRHGRAIQANFAVNDTLKKADLGRDRHSSKNITIPLNKGLLLKIEESTITPRMKSIAVRVEAEEGFNPSKSLDIKTLRFGCSSDINYGGGCRVAKSEVDGEDLILTFNTKGYQIPDSEFAPKLMGRFMSGELAYGYARNPNVNFEPAILSARRPTINGSTMSVVVENFGLHTSKESTLTISVDGESIAISKVDPIEPYAAQTVEIEGVDIASGVVCHIKIEGEDVVQLNDAFTLP